MIRRLRIKFICINMSIITVLLLVSFGTIFHFTREDLQQQSIRALEIAAQEQRRPGRHGELPKDVHIPFFAVAISPEGAGATVISDFFGLAEETQVQELVDAVMDAQNYRGVLPQYQLRYEYFFSPDGEKIVFQDISGEMETVKNLLRTCVCIGMVSFAAFLGLSIGLARWAIRPVEQAWEQQKQFVADASHELKTPLTVITTNAELLQEPEYGDAQKGQFAENILVMSRQMRALVEGLLELARTDNEKQGMDFEPLDLSELMADCLLLFEPVFFEKGLVLESEIRENLQVRGSRVHLQRVLEVLLDNAQKYTAPGGRVTVVLCRRGSHCLLSVATTGDPISKEDLQNIFKRFYRVDKVRTGSGSYGLGLSIAQNIVYAHGGKIWAESREGINTFYVQLHTAA